MKDLLSFIERNPASVTMWIILIYCAKILICNIRTLLINNSKLCNKCKYDIGGLPKGGVCPECGTVSSEEVLATQRRNARRVVQTPIIFAAIAAIMLFLLNQRNGIASIVPSSCLVKIASLDLPRGVNVTSSRFTAELQDRCGDGSLSNATHEALLVRRICQLITRGTLFRLKTATATGENSYVVLSDDDWFVDNGMATYAIKVSLPNTICSTLPKTMVMPLSSMRGTVLRSRMDPQLLVPRTRSGVLVDVALLRTSSINDASCKVVWHATVLVATE